MLRKVIFLLTFFYSILLYLVKKLQSSSSKLIHSFLSNLNNLSERFRKFMNHYLDMIQIYFSNLKPFTYHKWIFLSLHFNLRLLLTYSNPLDINLSIPKMYNNHRFPNDDEILPFFISDRKPFRRNSNILVQVLSFLNPRCQILILPFLIYYKNLTNLNFLLNLY